MPKPYHSRAEYYYGALGEITFLTSPADLIVLRQYCIHTNYIYGG